MSSQKPAPRISDPWPAIKKHLVTIQKLFNAASNRDNFDRIAEEFAEHSVVVLAASGKVASGRKEIAALFSRLKSTRGIKTIDFKIKDSDAFAPPHIKVAVVERDMLIKSGPSAYTKYNAVALISGRFDAAKKAGGDPDFYYFSGHIEECPWAPAFASFDL